MSVQATLAEAGLRFGGVPARAGSSFAEEARWAQLAALECLYDEALARRGLGDVQAAKIASAAGPALPPGIARIVVFGTPDPLPLAVMVLASHARTVPVEVVVAGPPTDEAGALFDAWGRPRTEAWSRRALDWSDFEEHVHLCADPATQAERLVALAQQYREPAGVLGIGVADPDVFRRSSTVCCGPASVPLILRACRDSAGRSLGCLQHSPTLRATRHLMRYRRWPAVPTCLSGCRPNSVTNSRPPGSSRRSIS